MAEAVNEGSNERVETQRLYDRISRMYDLVAESSEHTIRERGLRALALEPGQRVLDVGCGTGHGLVTMVDAVGPSGRTCGIDLSAGMLSVARERTAGRRVALVHGDARALCFRTGAFDALFFSFTLELFGPAIPLVLGEARRVLRAGGRIGVVGMADSADGSVAVEIYRWLHRHMPHLVDCAPTDIAGSVARAGFDVVLSETETMWALPVAVVIGRRGAN